MTSHHRNNKQSALASPATNNHHHHNNTHQNNYHHLQNNSNNNSHSNNGTISNNNYHASNRMEMTKQKLYILEQTSSNNNNMRMNNRREIKKTNKIQYNNNHPSNSTIATSTAPTETEQPTMNSINNSMSNGHSHHHRNNYHRNNYHHHHRHYYPYIHPYSSSSSPFYDLLLICKSTTIYNDQNIEPLPETNIYSFFKHVTPKITKFIPPNNSQQSTNTVNNTSPDISIEESFIKNKTIENKYTLKDLWNFYDEPYGIEIPIRLPNHQSQIENVYFVPHLSAIKLIKNKDEAADNEDHILFEFYESVTPDLRYPLIDKIEELSKDCTFLLDGTIDQLNLDKSWFAIAWYPILCHTNTMNYLGGQMITYHKFTPSHYIIDTSILNDLNVSNCNTIITNHSSTTINNNSQHVFEDIPEEKRLKNLDEYYIPIIGFLPYKVRNETWFWDNNYLQSNLHYNKHNQHYIAPLYLLQSSHRLLLKSKGKYHPDYYHCLKNSPELCLHVATMNANTHHSFQHHNNYHHHHHTNFE
ncbi:hypothetical protein ABK040_010047 [Willaertia magna]